MDDSRRSAERLLERDRHIHIRQLLQRRAVGSCPHPSAAGEAAPLLDRDVAEDRLKEIGKITEDLPDVLVFHARAAARSPARPLRPVESAGRPGTLPVLVRAPEFVVAPALLRIAEHFVGFVDLFEFFTGVLPAAVAVRMIFHRQFPVCFFDLVLAGGPRDSEGLIVVSIFHGFIWMRAFRTDSG